MQSPSRLRRIAEPVGGRAVFQRVGGNGPGPSPDTFGEPPDHEPPDRDGEEEHRQNADHNSCMHEPNRYVRVDRSAGEQHGQRPRVLAGTDEEREQELTVREHEREQRGTDDAGGRQWQGDAQKHPERPKPVELSRFLDLFGDPQERRGQQEDGERQGEDEVDQDERDGIVHQLQSLHDREVRESQCHGRDEGGCRKDEGGGSCQSRWSLIVFPASLADN